MLLAHPVLSMIKTTNRQEKTTWVKSFIGPNVATPGQHTGKDLQIESKSVGSSLVI
jgi:hypothetical protein